MAEQTSIHRCGASTARTPEPLLAEINTLLPPRFHPDAEYAARQADAWFDQARLPMDEAKRARLRGSEIGRGISAAFPRVSTEAVSHWARFCLWHLAFDDVCAEENAGEDLPAFLRQAGRLWLILHDTLPPEAAGDRFSSELRPLLRELDDFAPPVTANRVRHALRDYLFATAWEGGYMAKSAEPAFNEYLAFFRHVGFYALHLEFVELSPGAFLSEEARRDPSVRAMRGAACDLMTLVNYLCSVRFEKRHDAHVGPARAGGQDDGGYAERCLEEARTVARLRDTAKTDPTLGPFMTAAADWAAGTVWWHRRALAHRYATGDATTNRPAEPDVQLRKGA